MAGGTNAAIWRGADGLERFNYVLDALETRDPDALALLSLNGDGTVAARHSFGDLCRESRRMANALRQLGSARRPDRRHAPADP